MDIRPLQPEADAEGVVTLVREAFPLAVITPASWLHRELTLPGEAESESWVAESDGHIVGWAWTVRQWFTKGSTSALCSVVVAGSHRRRGIGTRLMARVDHRVQRLGATATITKFDENDAGVAFAQTHGFAEERAETDAVLDLASIEPAVPDLDLRPIAATDPHDAWLCDMEATQDMPSIEPIDHMPYEDWVEHVLHHPHFTSEGSYVAYVHGEPAAVSLLLAEPESGRSLNMFTGTRRSFRGQGLGVAVKLASVRWAKANGISVMVTQNDEENRPMLAINRRLGFVPAGRRVEYLRAETASSPAPPAPAP